MYLEHLSGEAKPLFMELILYGSMINGIIDEREEEMIKMYCKEMEYSDSGRRATDQKVEDICTELKKICSEKELKIILFELVYLVNSDRYIDMKESSFLREVSNELGLRNDFVSNSIILIDKYKDIHDLIDRLVLGKRN